MLATAIAVPTCLGVLAVDVTVDLNLGDAGLGLVVSAFWAVTAVAAPVAGRWVDRVGWPAGVRVGALVTAACLASCALVVDSWVALLVVFAISGVGYGLCSPTSNLVVVELVPPARHASVLGMKQTAPPLLMAAAGVTLPWLAHLLGWRAAMAAVLVLPAVVLLLAWRGARGHRARSRSVSRSSPVVRRAERSVIAPMAVAAGLGTFSVATITGFAVLTLVSAGLSPVVAAGVVSGGSLLAVVVRVAAGRFLDTRPASDVTPLLAVMALAGITLGLVAVGVTGLDAGEGAGAPWRAVVVAGVVL
ncbi:MAG: MFS transporter, partial [Thermocrispum agreste]